MSAGKVIGNDAGDVQACDECAAVGFVEGLAARLEGVAVDAAGVDLWVACGGGAEVMVDVAPEDFVNVACCP